jgi:signal transduction histidine kinase
VFTRLFKYIFILSIFSLFHQSARAIPTIEFSKSPVLLLDRDGWLFYHQNTFKDISNNPNAIGKPIKVPGNWNSLGYPNKSFGTYVFKFTHDLAKEDIVTLKLMTIGCSYDLFVNGNLIKSVGIFGTNDQESKPDFLPGNVSFALEQDTVEIAIQVSNYNYREGGLWFSPSIGSPAVMERNFVKVLFLDSFLIGSLFVLFCYFIAFYYIKTEDKTSLYFALLCLFAGLRIGATGDILIKQLNSSFPWELLVKIEYISLSLMLLFGVFYLNSLFPKDVNKKVLKIITYLQIIIGILFLITPVYYSSYFIPYYLLVCALMLGYLLNLVVKVMLVKRAFAIWVGGAIFMVFIAGLNDILYSQAVIKSLYLMPAAIFLFATIQALVLTKLFSNAFVEVETLSNKLKHINHNQKEIISERTSLLNSQAQELQKSNQIKDKVFSIIAHDLRAPIKSLSTVLSWVADDDLTYDELKKSLGSISKNVETLNLTLENLLQWSRSQLNGVSVEPELIDIRKPIQEIMELFKLQMAEKSLVFKVGFSERQAVFMDKHHLNLLLRNLVSNAIKFSKHSSAIEITTQNFEGDKTLIEVIDQGVGMSKEAIEKVFSPTDHYTTYGTNNEKGTGLGLLLCKEYVECSQGKIWIESTEGVGTKISFTLPNHGI